MNKAIFLDKDGTIVENSCYPKMPTDNILEGDIIDGLKFLQEKNYKLFIVSNQPWISKGHATKEQVDKIFESVVKQLASKGIKIEDINYCPHQSSDNCECKKGKPKIILDLAKKYNINLSHSFFIGDMGQDIEAGKNAGTKTILVLTGRGKDFVNSNPDFIIKNINQIKEVKNV
jgi:D-glycero-D-manno-heptose 1,7-bisphosphate phosphatase